MAKADYDLEIRLLAIEYMIAHIIRSVHLAGPLTEAEIEASETASIEQLRMLPLKGVDPAMSDAFSDDMATALQRILDMSAELRGVVRRKPVRKPLSRSS